MATPIERAPALPDEPVSANAMATPKASARMSFVMSLALTVTSPPAPVVVTLDWFMYASICASTVFAA